jgi:vacuolar protein sorting-associated protein 13A/C
LRILGSVDILGNPWGLIHDMGMGLFELADRPVTSLMHGPVMAPLGIIQGGLSLVKHFTHGTCNSLSKVSQSIARVVSILSVDPVY